MQSKLRKSVEIFNNQTFVSGLYYITFLAEGIYHRNSQECQPILTSFFFLNYDTLSIVTLITLWVEGFLKHMNFENIKAFFSYPFLQVFVLIIFRSFLKFHSSRRYINCLLQQKSQSKSQMEMVYNNCSSVRQGISHEQVVANEKRTLCFERNTKTATMNIFNIPSILSYKIKLSKCTKICCN